MKKIATFLLTFCMSTTIVMAAPGMSNYFQDHQQVSDDMAEAHKHEDHFFHILAHANDENSFIPTSNASDLLMFKIDEAIAKAEAEDEKSDVDEIIKRMKKKVDEMAKLHRAQVDDILKDKRRFDRIYYGLNQNGFDIDRKDLAYRLRVVTSDKVYKDLKSGLEIHIRAAGSLAGALEAIRFHIDHRFRRDNPNLTPDKFQSIDDPENDRSRHYKVRPLSKVGFATVATVGFLAASLPIFILAAPVYIPAAILVGIIGANVNFVTFLPLAILLGIHY